MRANCWLTRAMPGWSPNCARRSSSATLGAAEGCGNSAEARLAPTCKTGNSWPPARVAGRDSGGSKSSPARRCGPQRRCRAVAATRGTGGRRCVRSTATRPTMGPHAASEQFAMQVVLFSGPHEVSGLCNAALPSGHAQDDPGGAGLVQISEKRSHSSCNCRRLAGAGHVGARAAAGTATTRNCTSNAQVADPELASADGRRPRDQPAAR